jgi:hypothetical protein
MKISKLTLFLCLSLLYGCSTYRGIPTHGGGKRFDEEQRIIAAAIREAVAQIDLGTIQGRKISVNFSNLETSGSGQAIYSGVGGLNFNSGFFNDESQIRRIGQQLISDDGLPVNSNNNFNIDDNSNRTDGRLVLPYEFSPSLRSNNSITREDINYLQNVVEMHLRHLGFQVVSANAADSMLIILVDVLGTNLSRTDYGVLFDDELSASCELTYYVINPSTQAIINASQLSSAFAKYEETNVRFSPIRNIRRTLGKMDTSIISKYPALEPLQQQFESDIENANRSEVNSTSNEAKIDNLYQQALLQIEANNRTEADKLIRQIRKLDSDYPYLPELEQSLRQL